MSVLQVTGLLMICAAISILIPLTMAVKNLADRQCGYSRWYLSLLPAWCVTLIAVTAYGAMLLMKVIS